MSSDLNLSRFDRNVDPREWPSHRFGLSPARWRRLESKVIIVTGAGTGIGQALTIALAAARVRVVLCARRRDRLLHTLDVAAALGIDTTGCRSVVLDLLDPPAIAHAVTEIRTSVGHIFGLVNNAALPPPDAGLRALMQTTPDEWNKQIATNVTAPWIITRAVLGGAQPNALRIVFMTSAAGWGFAPGAGPYNVSKAALNSLAGSFAAECAACSPNEDIQINALDPGQVRSEMNASSADSPFSAANVALLLLSHARSGPTGHFFRADGTSVAFGNAPPYGGSLLDD